MQFNLTFEEREIIRNTKRFSKERILPKASELLKSGLLSDELKQEIMGLELLKIPFPEEDGGAGGTFTGFILALKELSYASFVPAWPVFENFMLAYPLYLYGSEQLKSLYLPGLISLDKLGGLAFTEPDTGSDPVQIKTIAEEMDGGWVINGNKRFITHSGICDHLILFARTADTLSAFLINSEDEGFTVGKRESFIHTPHLDNGDIILEDYFADNQHMIGKRGQGFEILLGAEAYGKIAFSSMYIGLGERAVDLSIQYSNNRFHRGSPIGKKFQMTQYKISEMAIRIEALNSYLLYVCSRVDNGQNIHKESACLKALVSEDIKGITSLSMEIHGAYGLSDEYQIGYLYKEAIGAQVIMGSLDIQRVIIARSLLDKGSYSFDL